MTRGLRRSLRGKLIGVVATITLIALLIALAAIITYDVRSYRRGWITDVSTQAELLGRTVAPALTFDDAQVAKDNLALLRLRPRIQAAAIYTARGALFATYSRDGGDAAVPALPEPDAVHFAGSTMTLHRRIVERGEIVGSVYLRTDYELGARIVSYVGIGAAVALLALSAALALTTRLQRVITRPILAVTGVARDVVERGDYAQRAPRLSDDEVGTLVDDFNRMLEQIERRTGELEVANRELARQVRERTQAEEEVLRLNTELEYRVRERTDQLQQANEELEKFCYSVSHDLRAPLRSIDGFSQALIEDFPDHIPDNARRYLTRIRTSTLRMSQLIEDLLNLSRVSRGPLDRREVDLSDLARQVLAELAHAGPARQVEVVVRDGMHTEGDPRLLRAALENLLGNAWKFSARNPAARIEVGALPDGERQIYFVRDNGAGFDMAYADKLFGAFQRLHGSDEFGGTGIGLATVQRIVQRHGGRIWADGQVGKGAAFYFTLWSDAGSPADAPETAAANEPNQSFSTGRAS